MDFFHLVSDQLVLHRSTATKLQRDRMGSVLDLATLSKGYTVQTFSLELRQMEKNEYQLHHIRGAK